MTSTERRLFQIQVSSRHPALKSLGLVREALDHAGAYVTDIRNLSNKASVFQVMLMKDRWFLMLETLRKTDLTVSPPGADLPASLRTDENGEIFGTVQLLYVNDDPEKADTIPNVPG